MNIYNIINFKQIDSTNAYAKRHIEKLLDKSIISADVQTNGYGRFNRNWVDLGKENIYMTFVLKPLNKLSETHANLTQYLSVCLCKELEKLGLKGRIKWPNDVLINGKKVCGILAETVVKGGFLKGIVLGIGINLKASSKGLKEIDRPATAINLELGKEINKQEFMKNLIDKFFADYEELLKKGFKFIKEDYQKRSLLKKDEQIKLAVFNKILQGKFKGFDDNGNLLLQPLNENIRLINMGEIV